MNVNYKLVDDEPSYMEDGYHVYEFYPNRKFKEEIYITIHDDECYANWTYMALFLFCDKNNIKIVTVGSLNYFPCMSLFCHTAYLHENNVYNFLFKFNTRNKLYLKRFSEIARRNNKIVMEKSVMFNMPNKDFVFKDEKKQYFKEKINSVSFKDIVEYYKKKPILFKKGTFKRFKESELPNDKIIFHIKKHPRMYVNLRRFLLHRSTDKMVGIDYIFQHELYELIKDKNDYMSFQILGSLFLNWKYVGVAGAASLFSMLPINCLLLTDVPRTLDEKICAIKRGLNKYFYDMETKIFPSISRCKNFEEKYHSMTVFKKLEEFEFLFGQ